MMPQDTKPKYWQKFSKQTKVWYIKAKAKLRPTNQRELRGHEHPKEPERNKK